jgi:hypothetical protein
MGVGRKHKLSLTVKHSDSIHALLVSDYPHNLVRRLAVVIVHGVPG